MSQAFGTFVDAGGKTTDLAQDEIATEATGSWTSPATGIAYPSGWRVRVQRLALDLRYDPVNPDQELDVRNNTGNIYWEGEVNISGTRDGRSLTGQGYVELTGYEVR